MTEERTAAASDAALIAASLTEPERFGEVYDRHAAQIHRFLARRVGTEAADDLVAETFLAAFRVRRRYDAARPDARPWLYGVATNLVHRHRRAERTWYRALAVSGVDPLGGEDHAEDVVARVSARADARAVAEALADLTTKERDVLLLYAWAGLSYEDIAAALAIPLGTVRSRLNRARVRLREAFDDTTNSSYSPLGGFPR